MTGRADLGVLQRVIEETGVDTTVPTPEWSGWLGALVHAVFGWLKRVLPGLPDLSGVVSNIGVAGTAVVVLMILAILFSVIRLLAPGFRRRARAVVPPRPPSPAPAPGTDRGRDEWKQEIDRRLAAGDVAGALEAAWWWFARAVSSSRVDASWTTQELLARSGRLQLVPIARMLDRLLYGSQRPTPPDVRRFLAETEAALR